MLRKRFTIILIVVSLFFATRNFLIINIQEPMFYGIRDVFAKPADIQIWFEGNSRRIRRKESAKESSYIWDGKKVCVSAARNE